MSRKQSSRRIRPQRVPSLVVLYNESTLEIDDRMALVAFREGWAGTIHWDKLAHCAGMLAIAATWAKDEEAVQIALLANEALTTIRRRHAQKNVMRWNGDEMMMLGALVELSTHWWTLPAHGQYFAPAHDEVQRRSQPQAVAEG